MIVVRSACYTPDTPRDPAYPTGVGSHVLDIGVATILQANVHSIRMQPIICTIQREVDVYVAMSRGRELAVTAGFKAVDRTRIEIVILELTRNLLVHAKGGTLILSLIDDAAHGRGLCVETRDNGPGIADIALAMQDGFSTAHTLGAGLPGVQRLMDVFQIESTVGVGTYVRAVKWVAPPQRTRIYGR